MRGGSLGGWKGTGLVAIGQLTGWGTLYYTYPVLAPAIASASGTSEGTVALAFSGTLLIAGALAVPIGRTMDHSGARPILLAGALVGPLALVLLATAHSLGALVLAFSLLGVAQALALYEPAFRAVVGWFEAERARRMALLLLTSIGGFASTIFAPATVALQAMYGWRTALMILAGLLAAVSLPIALAIPGSTLPTMKDPVLPSFPTPRSRLAPLSGLQWLALGFGVQSFAAMAVTVALLGHLLALGTDAMRAAILFGLMGAAQVPGRWITAPLQGMIADSHRLPMSLFLQACAILVLSVGGGPFVPGAALVFGALAGGMTLERAVVTARRYGTVHFGIASGRLAASTLVGRSLAPVVVEATRGAIGYGATLGGVALLLAASALLLGRPRPQQLGLTVHAD